MATKKDNSLKIAWKIKHESESEEENNLLKDIKPKKHFDNDAGYDLYATKDIVLKPHKTYLIKTGYAVQQIPPEGWNSYGKIEDTSGNAWKLKLKTAAGVIDNGYNGEIGVVIRNNHMFKKVNVKAGSKIAQIIFYLIPKTEEVEWVDKDTLRGEKGYGSSGTAEEKL